MRVQYSMDFDRCLYCNYELLPILQVRIVHSISRQPHQVSEEKVNDHPGFRIDGGRIFPDREPKELPFG